MNEEEAAEILGLRQEIARLTRAVGIYRGALALLADLPGSSRSAIETREVAAAALRSGSDGQAPLYTFFE